MSMVGRVESVFDFMIVGVVLVFKLYIRILIVLVFFFVYWNSIVFGNLVL